MVFIHIIYNQDGDILLSFKVLDLLMDNEFLTKETLDKFPLNGWKKDTHSFFYSITSSWDESKKYLLIYCEYDTKQYRDTVYDMEQETEAETFIKAERYIQHRL